MRRLFVTTLIVYITLLFLFVDLRFWGRPNLRWNWRWTSGGLRWVYGL